MKIIISSKYNILFSILFIFSISFAQKGRHEIVLITEVTTDRPNSAGGVNVNISWQNMSKKTIKYIKFGVEPYNAVNDAVSDEVSGDFEVYCESVGPHAPGAEESASWENTWYNNTIVRAKVLEVTITWMDGSKKYLEKNEFKVQKKK